MFDLGVYTNTVLMAYGVTALVLAGLIVLTWVQSHQAKRILSDHEKQHET